MLDEFMLVNLKFIKIFFDFVWRFEILCLHL